MRFMPTITIFRPSGQRARMPAPAAARRHPRGRVTIAAALLSVLAAACGGGGDGNGGGEPQATAPAGTEAPATSGDQAAAGDTVTGTGYSFTRPDGWSDATAQAKGIDQRVDVAVAGKVTSRFATNANVVVGPAQGHSLDDYVGAARQQLQAAVKADLVGDAEQLTVADAPAASYEYEFDQSGTPVHARQVIVVRDDKAYVVTFSAHADAFDDDIGDLDTIVESWAWA
jgi:hypothetical protein